MGRTDEIDLEALVAEIERYLAVVEVFRNEGYEPHWCDDRVGVTGADS